MFDVVMSWELGAGMGHITRLRILGQALIKQGLRVAAVVRDCRHCEAVFGGTGIHWIQAPAKFWRGKYEISLPRTFADILHNTGFGVAKELKSLAAAWRSTFEILKPKILVADHSPTALLGSRSLPFSRMIVGTGFAFPCDESPLSDLRPWLQHQSHELASTEAIVLDNINSVLKSFEVPEILRVSSLFHEVDEVALITFPELDHFGPRANVRYWGSWDSDFGIPPKWPSHPGKKVLAYLKPMRSLEAVVRTLGKLPLSAIVYAPEVNRELLTSWSSKNIAISDQPVNFGIACRECDFAVTNGTHGIVSRLLLAGKPFICFPLVLEQLLLSRKTERLGIGMTGDQLMTEQATLLIEKAVACLEMPKKASEIAQRYQRTNPNMQADNLARFIANKINPQFNSPLKPGI